MTKPAVLPAVAQGHRRYRQRFGLKLPWNVPIDQSVRKGRFCQHQGGLGLGSESRVNVSEPAINSVMANMPKMLTRRHEPKGKGTSGWNRGFQPEDVAPPEKSRHLTFRVTRMERGKPVFPAKRYSPGKSTAGKVHGKAGIGTGKKRMPHCNGVDRD